MEWLLAALFVGAGIVIALVERARWSALRPLYARASADEHWRRCFPDATPQQIREFLEFFADAFGFPKKLSLLFRPDDNVVDLYRALNPPDWTMADAGEFEYLGDGLLSHYAVKLRDVWHDQMTLGEIFQLTRRAGSPAF